MDPGTTIQPGASGDDSANQNSPMPAGDQPNTNDNQPATPPPVDAPAPPTPPAPPAGDAPAPDVTPGGDVPGGDSPPPTTPPDNPPAPPPTEGGGSDENANPATQGPDFTWEASEYVSHHRSFMWYVGLIAVGAGLVALLILVLNEILSAVVVGLMIIAILVFARKSPRTLRYGLSASGITIENKHYPYSDFRSFAVVKNGGIYTIELDPIKRFMPNIDAYLDADDVAPVTAELARHLPQDERQPALIDKLSHALKF